MLYEIEELMLYSPGAVRAGDIISANKPKYFHKQSSPYESHKDQSPDTMTAGIDLSVHQRSPLQLSILKATVSPQEKDAQSPNL